MPSSASPVISGTPRPSAMTAVTSAGRNQPEPALVEDLGHGIRIDATKILKHAWPRPASIVISG